MAAAMDDQENYFILDEISKIMKEAIEEILAGNDYKHEKVGYWTQRVVENCLSMLAKEQKPLKYVINVMIMQKSGAGLHSSSSCYWVQDFDGVCNVRWENKTMYCMASVFGLSV